MYPKIILILIIIINCKKILCDDTSCNDSQSKSLNLKLKKHLFCDYDPKVQPKTSVHTTTNVRVTLFPLIINLNEMSNTIDFHTWFHMAWKDEHLIWKPSDFGEIETFHTNSGDIWIPEISIFNIGAGGSNTDGDYTCHVRYNGTVSCLSVRVFTSRCQTDFTYWPYDQHNCTLHFGSWMYFANELKFEFNDNSLQMSEFIEHQEWIIEISNTTSQAEIYNTEEDAMFFVRINLQRHSARAIIVYLTPALVLMVLTLTVLWLDSSSIDRIAVACVNFICHILCIFDLHWYLPTTGAVNSPKIFCIKANDDDDDNTCNELSSKSPNLRLKKYLFCNYDATVRPIIYHNNKTEITITPFVESAEYNDYSDSLVLTTWLRIRWIDEYLKWTPKEYDYIDTIIVYSSEIWTPELMIQNAKNGYGSEILPPTKCSLGFGGEVICVPTVDLNVKCDTDRSQWPDDKHKCTIEFGSSYQTDKEIIFSSKIIIPNDRKPVQKNWKIDGPIAKFINKTSKFNKNDKFPVFTMTYNVMRINNQIKSLFLYPTIVLTILTLSTIWLDPGSKERIILACINFLCHLLCIQDLHWKIPLTGSATPNIMMFYYSSLLLALMSLILTCIFRYIVELKKPLPNWLSTHVSSLLTSKAGQIFLLSVLDPKASAVFNDDNDDDNNELVNSSNKKTNWNYFVILLGWLSFITFSLIYIIMYTLYIRLT
ncbi:hypothetical protein HCN44_000553 [Aphidius gifuensis]|uniref:Neurotransmitter-gated ion-channel ligand-binding domain-containing protein n=1 Tax=Aphidius gifuensis TaxID=684658 RepID=A0A834XNV2_APHGI|nr:hypothetical protein HCN44_000553 [Aphidius gifuensis]